jgi:GNS1/SUR4 family
MSFDSANDATKFHSKWLDAWDCSSGWWGKTGYTDYSVSDLSFLLGWAPKAELDYVVEGGGLSVRKYLPLGWVAVFVYLSFILLGQTLLKNREPFVLKRSLALWNLFLAVFSIIGTIRLVPYVTYQVYRNGFTYLICRCASVNLIKGPHALWLELFIWSKYPELIDTVFLVLRKRSVNFLHWFHHATVLLYCWYSYAYENPAGLLFAAMNYSVHAIMYTYYFLAAIDRPPRWGKLVTVLQIAQMFAGIAITVFQWRLSHTVENCYVPRATLDFGFLMYGAYLVLFLQFFVERYIRSQSKSKGD